MFKLPTRSRRSVISDSRKTEINAEANLDNCNNETQTTDKTTSIKRSKSSESDIRIIEINRVTSTPDTSNYEAQKADEITSTIGNRKSETYTRPLTTSEMNGRNALDKTSEVDQYVMCKREKLSVNEGDPTTRSRLSECDIKNLPIEMNGRTALNKHLGDKYVICKYETRPADEVTATRKDVGRYHIYRKLYRSRFVVSDCKESLTSHYRPESTYL